MAENKKRIFYSKLQLAMELNVCTRTVDNWMAKGLISYSKLGKRVIFTQADLDAFVQRNHKEAFADMAADELLISLKSR
jgi:hypothetical protein